MQRIMVIAAVVTLISGCSASTYHLTQTTVEHAAEQQRIDQSLSTMHDPMLNVPAPHEPRSIHMPKRNRTGKDYLLMGLFQAGIELMIEGAPEH
ncbi:hypothetical protein [Alteromonas sp. H39]|uniref:hypothetical protein n=1 Tax=Alteromonas sp. H39 TaxID=3389876 RepID=UPI0039E1D6DA